MMQMLCSPGRAMFLPLDPTDPRESVPEPNLRSFLTSFLTHGRQGSLAAVWRLSGEDSHCLDIQGSGQRRRGDCPTPFIFRLPRSPPRQMSALCFSAPSASGPFHKNFLLSFHFSIQPLNIGETKSRHIFWRFRCLLVLGGIWIEYAGWSSGVSLFSTRKMFVSCVALSDLKPT